MTPSQVNAYTKVALLTSRPTTAINGHRSRFLNEQIDRTMPAIEPTTINPSIQKILPLMAAVRSDGVNSVINNPMPYPKIGVTKDAIPNLGRRSGYSVVFASSPDILKKGRCGMGHVLTLHNIVISQRQLDAFAQVGRHVEVLAFK
jgi:hypothetical protein